MDTQILYSQELRVNWIKKLPLRVAVPVVTRAGIRVLPLWWEYRNFFKNSEFKDIDLRVMRCQLAVCAWSHFKSESLATECRKASELVIQVTNAMTKNSTKEVQIARFAANPVFRNARLNKTSDTTEFHYKAMVLAVSAVELLKSEDVGLWEESFADEGILNSGLDAKVAPLWNLEVPDWFAKAESRMRTIWAADPPGTWDFWLRWWDGVLSGNQVNWDLQRDIVLEVSDDDWQAGPARVAERIAEIEVRYAIARTPNAEILRINPATGLIRSDPVSHLRSDHLNDILDTLSDAAKVFDGHGGANGPYGAFEEECRIIDDTVLRYAKRPIMLLRICRRVVGRVKIKEANGDCPKDDPLVADFVASIASAAGDLMAFDQDVREAETARAATNPTPPPPAIATALLTAVDQSAEITEGDLKVELPADGRLAINAPFTPEGQDALFQTKSRLLRLFEITKSNGKHVIDHGEKYPVVYGTILAILFFLLG